MTTVLLLALVSQSNSLGSPVGDIRSKGFSAAQGGLIGDTLTLKDDIKLCFGDTTCNYWQIYASSASRFEFWGTDVDGAGADGLILKCDDGGDDCAFAGVLTATGGLAINADSTKLTLGASGATDSYLQFDTANLELFASSYIEMLAPVLVGNIVFSDDAGAQVAFDMGVTATPAAGTEESYVFKVDNVNNLKVYCEADSAGGVGDCHSVQYYSPVYNPSSDQALAGDANFDCDEGINRIAGSGGAVTLSASPSVNDGDLDGQKCIIQGTSDVNTVTINDNTNVQLSGGVAFTVGKGDILTLYWDAGDGDWYEESRSDN